MFDFLRVTGLFFVTAVAEIVGCYLPWLVLTQGRPVWWLLRLPLNFGALSPGFMRCSCAEPPASVARTAWG